MKSAILSIVFLTLLLLPTSNYASIEKIQDLIAQEEVWRTNTSDKKALAEMCKQMVNLYEQIKENENLNGFEDEDLRISMDLAWNLYVNYFYSTKIHSSLKARNSDACLQKRTVDELLKNIETFTVCLNLLEISYFFEQKRTTTSDDDKNEIRGKICDSIVKLKLIVDAAKIKLDEQTNHFDLGEIPTILAPTYQKLVDALELVYQASITYGVEIDPFFFDSRGDLHWTLASIYEEQFRETMRRQQYLNSSEINLVVTQLDQAKANYLKSGSEASQINICDADMKLAEIVKTKEDLISKDAKLPFKKRRVIF